MTYDVINSILLKFKVECEYSVLINRKYKYDHIFPFNATLSRRFVFDLQIFLLYVYVLDIWVFRLYIHLCITFMPGDCGEKKKASDSLETGVTNICVLVLELGSSWREVMSVNYWAIPLNLINRLFDSGSIKLFFFASWHSLIYFLLALHL